MGEMNLCGMRTIRALSSFSAVTEQRLFHTSKHKLLVIDPSNHAIELLAEQAHFFMNSPAALEWLDNNTLVYYYYFTAPLDIHEPVVGKLQAFGASEFYHHSPIIGCVSLRQLSATSFFRRHSC
jgi:hypothetical protein